MSHEMDPELAKKFGIPKKTTITLLTGETVRGTLINLSKSRIVVRTDSGRTLNIFKHAIKYFED